MKIKTILAAVDQFSASDDVLARACLIARDHGALLRIVHVIDMAASAHGFAGGFAGDLDRPDTLMGQAALAARERIDAALARLGPDTPDTDIYITTGSPALALIDLCKAVAPDLIVMRAHQRLRVSEAVLGSTSDRVIAAAVAPVLIVRRSPARPCARALVATDGTDSAGHTLAFAAALLPRASLRAVQVVQITPQLKEAMLRSGTDRAALEAHRATLIRNARTDLKTLAAAAPRPVRIAVFQGDPAEALTRAARIPSVDLIAIGPGRTGLIRRAFIGSVTRRLLRDAACDVLVCHPPAP